MEFIERIEAALDNKGISKKQFLSDLNLTKNTFHNWNQNKTIPSGDTLNSIALYLDVSVDYILNGINKKSTPQKRAMRKIPIYGKVAAGEPITALEDILGYVEIDEEEYSGGTFIALQLKGSSMEPKLSDGDTVIVRLQPDVESGQIAVMIINGDEATVKKLIKHKHGVMLVSTNPAFEPMNFTNEQIETLPVKVLGRVVELRAKF